MSICTCQRTRATRLIYAVMFAVAVGSLAGRSEAENRMSTRPGDPSQSPATPSPTAMGKATFGGGCFWCTEAVYQRLKGVQSVVSGYSGGQARNPTYKQVCTGLTGHAEVVQITYDPRQVTFDELLEVFWRTHDPTTLNRQGPDVGTQYRSVIFYHNEEQRDVAERYKQQLDKSHAFKAPIVTQIVPFREFFPAEDYHQNFYNTNPRNAYCASVIRPKIEKFNRAFRDKLKDRSSKAP
jgi:peptide-methionine (S)-S-oxide reductase